MFWNLFSTKSYIRWFFFFCSELKIPQHENIERRVFLFFFSNVVLFPSILKCLNTIAFSLLPCMIATFLVRLLAVQLYFNSRKEQLFRFLTEVHTMCLEQEIYNGCQYNMLKMLQYCPAFGHTDLFILLPTTETT